MANFSLNKIIEKSFKENWDRPALSDYKGVTLHYRDVARRIAKIHIIFEECGIQKGDKVALCARNQANWGVAFLACITYGAVPVPILHEFKASNVTNLVNHSEARILFVGDVMWEGLCQSDMPKLEAVILLTDFSLPYAASDAIYGVRNHLNEYFGKKYPKSFKAEDINYYTDSPEELALINYTSGTSGFSKGVMLPYRSLISNVLFAREAEPNLDNTTQVVSMLPLAHMYGLMFEFLFEMTIGAHVHFLTRLPTPKIILEAFKQVKPGVIIAVPMIVEKIYKKKLEPIVERGSMKFLLKLPVIDQVIYNKINTALNETFGTLFNEIIVGGAAFNKEAEAFFKKVGFRYTVGYGMTECGPIISYAHWDKAKLYSCGLTAPRMEIKIDSDNPESVAGEILVRGDNVFLGYYKNEEATKEAFTEDGWFRTGDLGVMDSEGYLYIRGRSKSMILGPSGQNIYPEEIESEVNNIPYVAESLVVEDSGKLVALIYPDSEAASQDGLTSQQLEERFQEEIKNVNLSLPNYCQISSIEIFPEEFEKTPKRSIKRYLYQRKK